MTIDYITLDALRQNHPAWRLLCAKHAPLVASFLQRVFIVPTVPFWRSCLIWCCRRPLSIIVHME
ncbi:MAG: hypothetical protein B6I36_07830 [Desulfobacteraceae bacterium 4572_35.1]|nr:MAG: hypothetical protein B6I36_07830 [Desulfobacteraceae bacterium 4572_35.1]